MRKAELVTEPSANAWDPAMKKRFANVGWIEGEGPGSGFWPFWLSTVMLICCIWIGVNWFRKTSPFSTSDQPYLDAYGRKMLLLVGGGLIGFVIAISFAGFYGATFLFMVYYLFVIGKHSVFTTLSIAIALPVISFFFFDVAMRIVLPKGYLEPLFIPLYEIFL